MCISFNSLQGRRKGERDEKALITGVSGQDGSYLAELLLEKGYDVHGMIRRFSVDYQKRIPHLEGKERFHLHYGDLGDSMSLVSLIGQIRPDDIYNLAAQTSTAPQIHRCGKPLGISHQGSYPVRPESHQDLL